MKDLTVEVEPTATVGDAGAAAALLVNPGSSITNNGAVTTSESAGVGLLGTNDSLDVDNDAPTTLTNSATGTIDVNGANGTGMKGAARSVGEPRIELVNEGSIRVNAGGGAAMDATDHGRATNSGTILLGSELAPVNDGVGLSGGTQRAELLNDTDGVIEGYGDSLTGMRIGDDNDSGQGGNDRFHNRGMILLTGDGAVGMEVGQDNERQLDSVNHASGVISILGDDGVGMSVADGSDARNLTGGQILVEGQNATGILATNGSSDPGATPALINQGEIRVDGTTGGARGFAAGDDNKTLRNTGLITVRGDGPSHGIVSGDGNSLENNGFIIVDSPDARGVAFRNSGSFNNEGGSVDVTGAGAIGVEFQSGNSEFDQSISGVGVEPLIQVRGTSAAPGIGVLGGNGDNLFRTGGGDVIALGDGAVAIQLPGAVNRLENTSFVSMTLGEIRSEIRVDDYSPSNPGIAVLGGDGVDDVFNSGDIVGDISLGGADDRFEQTTEGTWVGSLGAGFIDGGGGLDSVTLSGSGAAIAPSLDSFREFESLAISDTGSWTLLGTSSFGQVDVNGSNRVTLDAATIATGGTRGVQFVGPDGVLSNEGGRVEATGTSAVAVLFASGTNTLDNLMSSGERPEIRVSGSTDAEQASAVVGLDGALTVNNAGGLIEALGDRGTAVRFQGGTNAVNNTNAGGVRGVIRVDEFASATPGIAILGGPEGDRVFNAGDIEGDVFLALGDDTFELDTAGSWVGSDPSNGRLDGGQGTDEVVLSGSGAGTAPVLNGFSAFESLRVTQGGTWSLEGDGAFASVKVEGASGENTTVKLDGDVLLAGSYLQGAGTSLDVQLSSSDSRMLQAVGQITIDPDTTLLLDVETDARGSYTILESGVGLTGTFGDVQFSGDPSGLQRVDYSANALVFTVVRGTTNFAIFLNQRAVEKYLNAGFPTDPGPFEDAFVRFAGLSASEGANALDQMSAEPYDAQTTTMLSWGRSVTRVLEERPIRCDSYHYVERPEVRSKEPCGEKGWTPWVEGIGQWGRRKGNAGFASYDDSGGGIVFGVDRRFGDRWWATIDMGTGRVGVDIDGVGNGTLQTIDVGAAVGAHLGRGYLRAIASYGHGWHTTRRDIDYLGARAKGEHSSDRFTAIVDGGYPVEWQNLVFEPVVSLRYSYLSQGEVVESGVPGVNLAVAPRYDSIFSTSLGMRFYTALFKYRFVQRWLEWADGLWTPELNLNWRRTWTGANRQVTAFMPDAPASAGNFFVQAEDAEFGMEFGAHVRFQPLDSRMTFSLGYDGFWGDGALNHQLGVGARFPF